MGYAPVPPPKKVLEERKDPTEVQEAFEYIMEDYHTSRVFTAPEDNSKKSIILRKAWFKLWDLLEPLIIEDYERDKK